MEKYFEIITRVGLFAGILDGELKSMLNCLSAVTAEYKKGENVLLAGDRPEYVGVVLEGILQITKEDYEGNRTIMAVLGPGDLFAETLCCVGIEESPVSVVSDTDSACLLLNFARILHSCKNSCEFHQKLIRNMLRVVARKNLFLQSRMEVVRIKSVREKVLRYLESFAVKRGQSIALPLNREEMADYLCVDRSALSHELMRMRRDGLIDYRKNIFTLL